MFFKLVVFITVIVHVAILLEYDVISFEKDEQCERKYIPDVEQISNGKSDVVFGNERNILVLYDDTYGSLESINSMIQEKIEIDKIFLNI